MQLAQRHLPLLLVAVVLLRLFLHFRTQHRNVEGLLPAALEGRQQLEDKVAEDFSENKRFACAAATSLRLWLLAAPLVDDHKSGQHHRTCDVMMTIQLGAIVTRVYKQTGFPSHQSQFFSGWGA